MGSDLLVTRRSWCGSCGLLAAALLVLCWAACQQGSGPDDLAAAPEFGLGGKADGDLCDPSADLCWPTEQQTSIRSAMTGQDRLLLGLGDARDNARLLVSGVQDLLVKLDPVDREALAELTMMAEALPPDADEQQRQAFLAAAQDGPLGMLVAHYVAALSVPVGSAAEAENLGKADDFGTEADPGTRRDLTAGMRDSLDLLRESGVAGKLYALMFEQLGNLDDLPSLFDESFPFSEPREQRVERILDHYQLASAGASAVAGVEGLIPVAGILVSFSHKTIMDFRIRARLSLEIAMLYGVDVREGLNLFLVASTMMDLLSSTEVRTVIATNLGFGLLASAAFRAGVGTSVGAAVRSLASRAILSLMAHMGTRGAELAASAAARAATVRTVHQILGYLTLGLTVVADAAASAYMTTRVGRDAQVAFTPWAARLTTFAAPHLATATDRRCAALALGDILTADSTVDATEQRLLAALLGRASWVDGSWEWFTDEARQLALDAASVALPGEAENAQARQEAESCLVTRWRSLPSYARLAALGDLFTMAAVDGEITPAELARYTVYESLLIDGEGLTNFDLEQSHVDIMRQVITVLLATPSEELPSDQVEVAASVPLASKLEFLSQVPGALLESVTCAYQGTCQ